jgi:hypothetical protein
MRKWNVIVAALLACSTPALAEFEIVTLVNAVETSPVNIILPATTNGMMTYRGCSAECDKEYERARLTDGTSFTVEGKAVKYDDFRQVYTEIKNLENSYALVSVDMKTGTVMSINLAR